MHDIMVVTIRTAMPRALPTRTLQDGMDNQHTVTPTQSITQDKGTEHGGIHQVRQLATVPLWCERGQDLHPLLNHLPIKDHCTR